MGKDKNRVKQEKKKFNTKQKAEVNKTTLTATLDRSLTKDNIINEHEAETEQNSNKNVMVHDNEIKKTLSFATPNSNLTKNKVVINEHESEDVACLLCSNVYNSGEDKFILNCSHAYCTSCISKLIFENAINCPKTNCKKTHIFDIESICDKSDNHISHIMNGFDKKSSIDTKHLSKEVNKNSHKTFQNELSSAVSRNTGLTESINYVQNSENQILKSDDYNKKSVEKNQHNSHYEKSLVILENNLSEKESILYMLHTLKETLEITLYQIESEERVLKRACKDINDYLSSIHSTKSRDIIHDNKSLQEINFLKDKVEDSRNGISNEKKLQDLLSIPGPTWDSKFLRTQIKSFLSLCLQLASNEKVFAVLQLQGRTFYAPLVMEGDRLHLHKFQNDVLPSNIIQIPFQCIKECFSTDAGLTFIQVAHGTYVYIRLMGETQLGVQFMQLCSGENGFSFKGTPFHRVWWMGKPGEHVWTGDYDEQNGSGGKPLSCTIDSDLLRAHQQTIIAGLVAGRGKDDNSTIFKIFTRPDDGCTDDAAFGIVEYGLDVIQKAVQITDITHLVIENCGLVIEF